MDLTKAQNKYPGMIIRRCNNCGTAMGYPTLQVQYCYRNCTYCNRETRDDNKMFDAGMLLVYTSKHVTGVGLWNHCISSLSFVSSGLSLFQCLLFLIPICTHQFPNSPIPRSSFPVPIQHLNRPHAFSKKTWPWWTWWPKKIRTFCQTFKKSHEKKKSY